MQVETAAIGGTYEELVDAAEGIGDILSAKANNRLDLTPTLERWLIGQLEAIEVALVRNFDAEHGEVVANGRNAA
jgi:hypothetical protein